MRGKEMKLDVKRILFRGSFQSDNDNRIQMENNYTPKGDQAFEHIFPNGARSGQFSSTNEVLHKFMHQCFSFSFSFSFLSGISFGKKILTIK